MINPPQRANGERRFCPRPFKNLAIEPDGTARTCCGDWLTLPIGNVGHDGVHGVWNSDAAAELRASIHDGSFRHCCADACPDLVQGTLPRVDELPPGRLRDLAHSGAVRLDEGPLQINLSYDNSCNLKCPTCRSDFVMKRGADLETTRRLHERVLAEVLDGTPRTLLMTGSGDALASPVFREFLRSFQAWQHPGVSLILMTNGLLFTPAMWRSMEGAQPAVSCVTVSVDAATPGTYAVTRGGDFTKLTRNLEFLGRLAARGSIGFFEISFVVQAANFLEMPAFAEWGRDLGCGGILFQKLMSWEGALDPEEHARAAVHEPAHLEHGAYLEVLCDLRLRLPGVDLSNLVPVESVHQP